MPGMMDTVLNIGLNEQTVLALAKQTGNERFAWDSYRRFVQMYGDVVLDLKPKDKKDADPFEEILHHKKEKAGAKFDSDLNAAQLKELVVEFKKAIKDRTGHDFPNDPMEQVWGAIGATWKGQQVRQVPALVRHARDHIAEELVVLLSHLDLVHPRARICISPVKICSAPDDHQTELLRCHLPERIGPLIERGRAPNRPRHGPAVRFSELPNLEHACLNALRHLASRCQGSLYCRTSLLSDVHERGMAAGWIEVERKVSPRIVHL
jgi:hypothetical protein